MGSSAASSIWPRSRKYSSTASSLIRSSNPSGALRRCRSPVCEQKIPGVPGWMIPGMPDEPDTGTARLQLHRSFQVHRSTSLPFVARGIANPGHGIDRRSGNRFRFRGSLGRRRERRARYTQRLIQVRCHAVRNMLGGGLRPVPSGSILDGYIWHTLLVYA